MRVNGFVAVIASALIATFFAFNLYMVFVIYSEKAFKWVSFPYFVAEYLSVAGYFLGFGLPMVFAITVLLGGPLYWVGVKLDMVNFFTISSGGLLIAVIPLLICKYSGWNIPSFSEPSGLVLFACVAFSGLVGGFVFFLLRRKGLGI